MSLIKRLGLELRKIYKRTLLKLNTLKGTPESISKGFATGVAMSFTPFVGFHLILSLMITKITKQNGTAAALGMDISVYMVFDIASWIYNFGNR